MGSQGTLQMVQVTRLTSRHEDKVQAVFERLNTL